VITWIPAKMVCSRVPMFWEVVPEVQLVTRERQEAAMTKAIIQSKVRQIRRWLKVIDNQECDWCCWWYFYLLEECRMLNARVSPPHFYSVHLVLSWHKNWLNFSLRFFIPISMQNQDYLYSSFPSKEINLWLVSWLSSFPSHSLLSKNAVLVLLIEREMVSYLIQGRW